MSRDDAELYTQYEKYRRLGTKRDLGHREFYKKYGREPDINNVNDLKTIMELVNKRQELIDYIPR